MHENTYDLVITDINMPGNSELEFVRELAAFAGGVSIILVTAYPSITSAVQSIELPVIGYLVKPFDFQELLAKVRIAAESVGVQLVVRGELARLQEYRQDLLNIEKGMHSPRAARAQQLEALVAMTMRNVVEGLSSLHSMVQAAGGQPPSLPAVLPGDLREALHDAVATLERTKGAFKSKELGELRKRLQVLLRT